MPIPMPSPEEMNDHNKFMQRCMGDQKMNDEYPDQKQRAAVCFSSFKKAKQSNSFEIDFSKEIQARDISTKERKNTPDSNFVDPERKSFPINKPEDIPAAVHSWGRYKGSMTFEEFKARLTRIAKEKGWESQLPEEWKK